MRVLKSGLLLLVLALAASACDDDNLFEPCPVASGQTGGGCDPD